MRCDSLSASRVKCFDICQFKYYIEYVLSLEQPKKFPTEQGTFCHEIYEELAKARKDGDEDPEILKKWMKLLVRAYRRERSITNRFGEEEVVPALWTLSPKALEREKSCDSCPYFKDDVCWVTGLDVEKFKGCPRDEFDDSTWLIEKVLEDDSRLNPVNRKILDTERFFAIDVDDGVGGKIRVNGVMDLAIELDDETVEVVDYKTGKWMQSYSDCLEDPQLMIYHLAAKHLYPRYKYVFITIWYLRKRMMTFAFGPDDEKRVRERVIKTFHDIRSNEFPRRRCDRPSGFVHFDWMCERLCNPEACQREFEKVVREGQITDGKPRKRTGEE